MLKQIQLINWIRLKRVLTKVQSRNGKTEKINDVKLVFWLSGCYCGLLWESCKKVTPNEFAAKKKNETVSQGKARQDQISQDDRKEDTRNKNNKMLFWPPIGFRIPFNLKGVMTMLLGSNYLSWISLNSASLTKSNKNPLLILSNSNRQRR